MYKFLFFCYESVFFCLSVCPSVSTARMDFVVGEVFYRCQLDPVD